MIPRVSRRFGNSVRASGTPLSAVTLIAVISACSGKSPESASGAGGTTSVVAGGSTGANTTAGGSPGVGGSTVATGDRATGGAGGDAVTATGGNATGGTATATGGSVGVGGTTAVACALTADRIRITEVDVGATVVNAENWGGVSQPLAISPIPSGGSRVGFMGNDAKVHIVTLDQNDQLVAGSAMALAGLDFVDLYADNNGGVVLLNRDSLGGGHLNCGTLANLCGNASSIAQAEPNACWDMYMVRFDGSAETWAVKLTDSTAADPPYRPSTTASGWQEFIWASSAYPHRGRIASDGSNYAGYHGISIAVSEACVQSDSINSTGINIHQGDRLTVVNASGARVDSMGIETACSHSFYQSIGWDPAASRFVAVCMTDNSNRLSLANKNMAYSTIRPLVAFNQVNVAGGVALGANGDYWIATSDGESSSSTSANVYLLRFTVSASKATLADTIEIAAQASVNERAPYVAAYGTDGLIVGWETAGSSGNLRRNDTTRKMYVQVRSRATGSAIGDALNVAVLGNQYQDFRSFPDGSVAFPAPGSSNTKLKILRILPCGG